MGNFRTFQEWISFCRVFLFAVLPNLHIKMRLWGWRAGSLVKSAGCSSRGWDLHSIPAPTGQLTNVYNFSSRESNTFKQTYMEAKHQYAENKNKWFIKMRLWMSVLMWFQFFACISVCCVEMGTVCLLFACIGVHQNECGEADPGCGEADPGCLPQSPVCWGRIPSLNSELSDSDHLASPPAMGDVIFPFLLRLQSDFLVYPAFEGVMKPQLWACLGQALSDEPSPHLPNITLLSPLLISETGFCFETGAHCTPLVGLELTETTCLGFPNSGIKGVCR